MEGLMKQISSENKHLKDSNKQKVTVEYGEKSLLQCMKNVIIKTISQSI